MNLSVLESEEDLLMKSEKIRDTLYLIVYSLTGIAALVGNSIVIHVVRTNPRIRNFVHILLANMAVSDIACALSFFFGLLLCWDHVINSVGNSPCVINKCIQLLSFQVSSVTMTVVAVDRWISVFYPLYSHTSNKRSVQVISYTVVLIWASSFLIIVGTSPAFAFQRYFHPDALITCDLAVAFDTGNSSTLSQRVRLVIANLAHFWVPLSTIIVAYGSIAHKVWKRQVGQDVTQGQLDVLMTHKWKTIKMLIAAVVVFFGCWVPFFIYNMFAFSSDSSKKRPCNQTVPFLIVIWIAFSSCCYNPIIYWIYNDTYRQGFIKLFHCVGYPEICFSWKYKRNQQRPSQQPIHPCNGETSR